MSLPRGSAALEGGRPSLTLSWVALDSVDLCHPIPSGVPFTRDGWLSELKHEGFRALARTGSGTQLLSRSGRSMEAPFPEIVAMLERLPDGLVLDGELVVPGTGLILLL